VRFLATEEGGIAVFLAALCAVLAYFCPGFLTADNLLTVARQFSVYGTIAVGMTFVIVAGDIDLSVGSVLAMSACLSATLVTGHAWPLPAAMLVSLAAGATAGGINGWLTVGLGIPSFIITLGMMSVIRGITYVFTQAMPISGLPDSYIFLGSGTVFGVTVPVLAMGVVALTGGVVLAWTRFGRAVYAVGGNLEAARLSGVPTGRVRIMCFTLLGTLSALAGMLTAGWVSVAQPVAGVGYELDVIAAVIIGGASFSGGRGTVLGTMLGATLMGVLRNGLILLGVNVYWQKVALGAVIVSAVTLDRLRRRT
jgi:ribose/xylose/arabinose/galactoside ABC-type transport system permease subunit